MRYKTEDELLLGPYVRRLAKPSSRYIEQELGINKNKASRAIKSILNDDPFDERIIIAPEKRENAWRAGGLMLPGSDQDRAAFARARVAVGLQHGEMTPRERADFVRTARIWQAAALSDRLPTDSRMMLAVASGIVMTRLVRGTYFKNASEAALLAEEFTNPVELEQILADTLHLYDVVIEVATSEIDSLEAIEAKKRAKVEKKNTRSSGTERDAAVENMLSEGLRKKHPYLKARKSGLRMVRLSALSGRSLFTVIPALDENCTVEALETLSTEMTALICSGFVEDSYEIADALGSGNAFYARNAFEAAIYAGQYDLSRLIASRLMTMKGYESFYADPHGVENAVIDDPHLWPGLAALTLGGAKDEASRAAFEWLMAMDRSASFVGVRDTLRMQITQKAPYSEIFLTLRPFLKGEVK